MTLAARIALAVAVLLFDFVTFFLPLGALVVAWVIVVRPRWALELVVKLYEDVDFRGPSGRADAGAPTSRPPAN